MSFNHADAAREFADSKQLFSGCLGASAYRLSSAKGRVAIVFTHSSRSYCFIHVINIHNNDGNDVNGC